MKVVVMAAGIGSRLAATGYRRPKCLLKANGETLIARLLRLCHEQGLQDVSVVVGYQHRQVEREINGLARCYHNDLFAETNSLMSLWHAREELDDDLLLMNGDLYFEPGVLQAAIRCPHPIGMLADRSRIDSADYRFAFADGLLVRHGKHLTPEETDAEYVGIARVAHQFVPAFRQRLEEYVHAGRVHEWWEEVLYSYLSEGVPIYPEDVTGLFWTEVDCAHDLQRLTRWLERQSPESRTRSPARKILV